MSSLYLTSTLLGMLAFCITMKSQSLKPVGPKMCDHLCKYRAGCTLYKYSPVNLACELAGVKNESHQYITIKDTNNKYAQRNLTCQEGSVIFHTRANKLLCRRLYVVKEQRCKKPKREYPTRVDTFHDCPQKREKGQKNRLVMLNTDGKSQGRQFFLHNNSVVPCQNIRYIKPTALTYLSSAKKLIIAALKPNRIVLVSLEQGKTSIIRMNRYIASITADEETQDLFFVDIYSRSIRVMTITGKIRRKLVSTKKLGDISITADSKRDLIYGLSSNRRYIYNYTYSGVCKGAVVCAPKIYFFNFNPNIDVLYYLSRYPSTIFSLSLTNGSKTKIKKLGISVHQFYVVENTIYVYTDAGKIRVFPGEGNILEVKTGFSGGILTCLIS